MADFLKFLRSLLAPRYTQPVAPAPPPPTPAEIREQQNRWIKERFREWQVAWHDAFDADPQLRAAGELDRPDPLPVDIGTDHRLIFGFSDALPATRATCLALFPEGAEMHRRLEAFMAGPPPMLSEDEARVLVAELARAVEAASPEEAVDWSRIAFVDREAAGADAILSRAGPVRDLFAPNLRDPRPEAMLPAVAAKLFLTEPLYASAGNFYELCDWVTGAMFEPTRDRAYEATCLLWNGGWQPLVSPDGVVLARGHRG